MQLGTDVPVCDGGRDVGKVNVEKAEGVCKLIVVLCSNVSSESLLAEVL
jgi:hypothetical protein